MCGRFAQQAPTGAQCPGQDNSEPQEGDGFVIITADSNQGMVDIHDRRPVVLSPECAASWIDPELPAVEAEEIIRRHGEPVNVFEWYPVRREVGNVKNEGPGLIAGARL